MLPSHAAFHAVSCTPISAECRKGQVESERGGFECGMGGPEMQDWSVCVYDVVSFYLVGYFFFFFFFFLWYGYAYSVCLVISLPCFIFIHMCVYAEARVMEESYFVVSFSRVPLPSPFRLPSSS